MDVIFEILTVIGIIWVVWLWIRDAIEGVRRTLAGWFGAPPAREATTRPSRESAPSPERHVPAPDYRPPAQRDARAWMESLARDRDGAPHLLILGPTGSGKTTLVLALLSALRGEAVIVSPKNARDDAWGGFPVVRLAITRSGPDWGPIAAAIDAVKTEHYRRHADGNARRDPLWLVIDELPMIIEEIPGVADTLRHLWRMGRSVNIRVVGISQTALARDLGLEGRSSARDNLTIIQTISPAGSGARIYPWGRDAEARPLSLDGVADLAQRASVSVRPWIPSTDGPSEAFTASESQRTARPSVRPSVRDEQNEPELPSLEEPNGRTVDRREVLAALRAAGVSRYQARQMCERLGWGFANDLWTEVR